MGKAEIREALKKHGFTAISKSWFFGDPEEKSVIFNAYDESGNCHRFFISWGGDRKYAMRQCYSTIMLHDPKDATYIFFKEG